MSSAIAACGIWPALPLTGYWLLGRVHSSRARGAFPVVTYFCLMTVVGIAVWSLPMLGSAIAGVYRAEFVGILGWAVTVFAAREWLKRRDVNSQVGLSMTAWDWVLAGGLLVAAVLYLGFAHDPTLDRVDEAIYANHGIYIAHHGKLTVPYPWPGDSEPVVGFVWWSEA